MFNTQNAGVNIIDSVGHLPFVPPPEGICGAAAHPSFYILSMAQVESEALTTHSAPPHHFTPVKHISHKTSSNSDSGCCCPSFSCLNALRCVQAIFFT